MRIVENCKELKNCKHKLQKLQEASGKPQKASLAKKFIMTDHKVRLNTELPNKAALNSLYEHLQLKLRKGSVTGLVANKLQAPK